MIFGIPIDVVEYITLLIKNQKTDPWTKTFNITKFIEVGKP